MQVQYGTYRDIEAWMNLVEELRGKFPRGLETKESLTEHRETVLRFMKKRAGIVRQSRRRKLRVCFCFQKGTT